MKNILLPRHRAALARHVRGEVLLGLDSDGPLAPIVDDPAHARLRVRTRRLVRAVAARYPCVVISGRARVDVGARVDDLGLRAVIGNHGLEADERAPRRVLDDVAGWRRRLAGRLAGWRGVEIEDKGLSLAVHYRRATAREAARAAIVAEAAELDRARIVGGACVVNVLPAGGAHKGVALDRARRALGCTAALYVGDDDTDEDVFRNEARQRLLAVRVGRRTGSAAPYYVETQRHVDELLRLLALLRPLHGDEVDRRPHEVA